jgi:hypothetical protein
MKKLITVKKMRSVAAEKAKVRQKAPTMLPKRGLTIGVDLGDRDSH